MSGILLSLSYKLGNPDYKSLVYPLSLDNNSAILYVFMLSFWLCWVDNIFEDFLFIEIILINFDILTDFISTKNRQKISFISTFSNK
jgi:hypothetical protein